MDIDHQAVIQFDRVIKVEMSYDGAASEVARQYSASVLLSDLKGLFSPCVSLLHILMTFTLSVFPFSSSSVTSISVYSDLFVSVWLLTISGIEKLCNVSPKTFEYLK